MRESHSGKTILVIGASGQLGRELLLSLAGAGRIVATVRPESMPPRGCQFETLDLVDPGKIRAVVRDVRPALIVNAAAYTAVDHAERDPEAAMAVNGTAPEVLAREGQRIGASLIHYSTDYVFDGSGDRPWKEDDVPNPINVYGQTKLFGEQAIRATDVPHVIIRTSWLYGSFGQNFVKKILEGASRESDMAVVDDQIGAPTSARLVAMVTRTLIENAGDDLRSFFKRHSGILHAACAGETSWFGFADEILRQAKGLGLMYSVPKLRPIPSTELRNAAPRPNNSRLNLTRLRSLTDLPIPDWRSELLQTLFPVVGGSPKGAAGTSAIP